MPSIPNFGPTTIYARLATLAYPTVVPTVNAVAAAVTYSTAEILSGLVLRDALSSARADLLPKAADLVAAINGCQVNTSFRTVIRNTGAGAGSITLTANTGATISGTAAIVFQQQKELLIVITNVTPGAEAYTAYSLGVSVAI
jgi:hypothetical protein